MHGSCRTDHVWPFLAPLLVINVTVLLFANVQAYLARALQAEFAESACIGFAMVIMLQAIVMGFPGLFIVKENPVAFYVILVLMITAVYWTILGLIFVPKVIQANTFSEMTKEKTLRALQGRLNLQGIVGKEVSSDLLLQQDLFVDVRIQNVYRLAYDERIWKTQEII
jgi:7 transmembrane sweet-taste receptor of 3 GCPR